MSYDATLGTIPCASYESSSMALVTFYHVAPSATTAHRESFRSFAECTVVVGLRGSFRA